MSKSVKRRRQELLEYLGNQHAMTIRQMSEELGVSQSTLRRDLDAMEEEGLVERIHGSARLVQFGNRPMDMRELWFFNRQDVAVAEKQAIARAAIELVAPDDVIVMDSSTTGLHFAKNLPTDFSLTVITHSAYLPVELSTRSDLQVISTGGLLQPKSMCYVGLEAETAFHNLHAHRAFFGAKGLSLREGCTDVSPLEVRLKSVMLKKVQELVILADHTKLGNIALASFAPVSRISTLITDEGADPDFVDALRRQRVNVIVAPLLANHA